MTPEYDHTNDPETIALTIGDVWHKGEIVSRGGLLLTREANGQKTIALGSHAPKIPIARVTAVIGGAPLLDLHDFIQADTYSAPKPEMYIIIDPKSKWLSPRMLEHLTNTNGIDTAMRILLDAYRGDIQTAPETLNPIRQALYQLQELLPPNFIHLLPFDLDFIANTLRQPFIDRIVCLHPIFSLSIPTLIAWAQQVLEPSGELIVQTEITDTQLMLLTELQRTTAFQIASSSFLYTSLYALGLPNAHKTTTIIATLSPRPDDRPNSPS